MAAACTSLACGPRAVAAAGAGRRLCSSLPRGAAPLLAPLVARRSTSSLGAPRPHLQGPPAAVQPLGGGYNPLAGTRDDGAEAACGARGAASVAASWGAAPAGLEILRRALGHGSAPAVISGGTAYSYASLLGAAARAAAALGGAGCASPSGPSSRVALLAAPGPEYVAATWGIWMAGGTAVPLALSHPPAELAYVLEDAGCTGALAGEGYGEVLAPLAASLGIPVVPLAPVDPAAAGGGVAGGEGVCLPDIPLEAGALVIYTSGTTGRPKGALHTHGGIQAQVRGMVTSWGWNSSDRILHALPLHHVHGIVNALYCAHFTGAAVEMHAKFSPQVVWERLQSGEVTVFMGVPTMYHLLLKAYDKMPAPAQAAARAAAAGLRLAVSGSAACPVPLMARWEALSGEPMLERYGMTEIGMALSNPYRGERRPGHVGVPLPGVEVKIIPEDGAGEDGPGELLVRGSSVFREYLGRPSATAESFTPEGFFKTGDVAQRVGGYWKILGRASADIIKFGGYKLSALEIENVLLENADISECAVLGMPDEAYGEVVWAVMAMVEGAKPLDARALGEWAGDKLAPYKVPKAVVVVRQIPRNAMGKVNKKELRRRLEAGEEL